MIFLELFWTFFKIGLFTFGGGYAMIPLIQQEVLGNEWMDSAMLYNFIGISEATPGPIAVNMATFVGSTVGDYFGGSAILGAVCATLGVVLPSFIIILIVAALLKSFMQNKVFAKILGGVKPVVVGLIFAAGALLVYSNVVKERLDFIALALMLIMAILSIVYKRLSKKKKDLSPILMIVISAALGMAAYTIF